MPRKDVLDHLACLYSSSDDPWEHRTSPYEAAKYRETLAIIGNGPFDEALEIGCGNGSLARLLAPRCRRLTAMDCIPAACAAARLHLDGLPQVIVVEGAAPDALPTLRPDLVLLSEVLYFLTPEEIAALGEWLLSNAAGPVIAVNWTGPTDEPLDGTRAVELLVKAVGPSTTWHFEGFRIDRFSEMTVRNSPLRE